MKTLLATALLLLTSTQAVNATTLTHQQQVTAKVAIGSTTTGCQYVTMPAGTRKVHIEVAVRQLYPEHQEVKMIKRDHGFKVWFKGAGFYRCFRAVIK